MREEIKTLQQCKDEVAIKYNYTGWCLKIHENGDHFTEKMWTEAAELYASQFTPSSTHRSVEKPDLLQIIKKHTHRPEADYSNSWILRAMEEAGLPLHSKLQEKEEEIEELKEIHEQVLNTNIEAHEYAKSKMEENGKLTARIKELEEALRKSLKYVDEGSCMLQDTECTDIK